MTMHYVEAKGILSANGGMNVYRGCTHGCIYCDSRSVCYQIDHDFEDIAVKINAPELLDEALSKKRTGCMVGTGSMSDPYNPVESTELITRKCLEVIEKHGCGVALLTKSDLVLRDLDILSRINERTKCVLQMTLTTYDESLCRILEPNVATTARRAEVLRIFDEAGIPTVVWMTPTLPYINDTPENLLGIIEYCRAAHVKGIIAFGFGLTLRDGDREYYYSKLDEHFPGLKRKYIERYGLDYELPSENSAILASLFRKECAASGIMTDIREIFEYMHRFEDNLSRSQMTLF